MTPHPLIELLADTPVPRLLLTPREAAEALAISERTLWQLTHDQALPCVRIGRSVRYRPEALRTYLDHQTEGALP
jgi:excisionase family DNA binding protein